MRLSKSSRVLFVLTLTATLVSCTTGFARGRAGGGRVSGGRTGAVGRPGGAVSRPGSAVGGKRLPSQATRAGSKTGNLKSRLATDKQLQGLLQGRSGQFQNSLSQKNGQFQQSAQSRVNQFQSGAAPLSPAWYAEHPNAWKATHPYAGAAVVGSAAAVAAWVGTSGTVAYQEAPTEEVTEESASTNTEAGVADSNHDVDQAWLPLGIYSVSTTADAPPTLMLQLVVDHQGILRGVYYDSLTSTSHDIVGQLNRETQVAQWSLESNKNLTFEAPLEQLTQPVGQMRVTLPTGPQQWGFVQVEYHDE